MIGLYRLVGGEMFVYLRRQQGPLMTVIPLSKVPCQKVAPKLSPINHDTRREYSRQIARMDG